MAVPNAMMGLSATLPARVNRATNLVVAALYVPVSLYNDSGESCAYSSYGLSIGLGVLLLAYDLLTAWNWIRTTPGASSRCAPEPTPDARATVPTCPGEQGRGVTPSAAARAFSATTARTANARASRGAGRLGFR